MRMTRNGPNWTALLTTLFVGGLLLYGLIAITRHFYGSGLEQSAEQLSQQQEVMWLFGVVIAIMLLLLFLTLPVSRVLNVVTVPLGYEYHSCPFCPAFGVRKITYTECANCGTEITENFSGSVSPAGDSERYYFCDRDCKSEWREE